MGPDRRTDPPEELVARIVAVAYGDAGPRDRWRVYREARRNPVVRELIEAHRGVADEVRRAPRPTVPDAVVERAWDAIVRQEPRAVRRPVLSLRALYASGATLAAALCVLLVLQVTRPSAVPPETYSQAEIEEARHQLEAAFALVNQSVAKAGLTLNHDVLVPNVIRPIRGGTAIVEQLFRKENAS